MAKKIDKQSVIKEHQISASDTGSADVQIALLSGEIEQLQSHLKKNPKDEHSRRGLLKMVIKRKRLLKYLAKDDAKRYEKVVKKLGLKA
ncbi:MAG: 30S ribosomal protein S15 [Patescibacteria group bacterium]|nr:30S ribosomal protein S15 [Patescibacteria group bacterium]